MCLEIIDSNKIRQLFKVIKQYNEQVAEEEGKNKEMVESRLSVVGYDSGENSLIWPWEVHSTGMEQLL